MAKTSKKVVAMKAAAKHAAAMKAAGTAAAKKKPVAATSSMKVQVSAGSSVMRTIQKIKGKDDAKKNLAALSLEEKLELWSKKQDFSAPLGLDTAQQKQLASKFQVALVKAELAKAGFQVNSNPKSNWSAILNESTWDAAFYAWGKSALLQTGNFASYKSTVNDMGYENARVDAIIEELEVGNFNDAERYSRYLAIEKIMAEDAVSLPIFLWPTLTAFNSDLKGVSPAPLVPNGLWNFWDWKYY
jgi:ABC-type oligopeptide transport system substrate-binding subunit